MSVSSNLSWADLLPGGAAVVASSGKLLAVNPALPRLFTTSAEQLIGRDFAELFAEPAEEARTFCESCLGCNEVVRTTFTCSSSKMRIDCAGRRIGDGDSDESPTLAVTFVPSARPETSAEAEASDPRDRLLALLIHDFRNGLASVPMGFDLLEMERGKSETLDLLRRQIERLVRMVDEALDISRSMRGKIKLRPEKVVIQEVVEEAVLQVKPLLQQRKLEVDLLLPSESISWTADPQRLVQALVILLYERCKNMPAGGKLKLSAVATANRLLISMSDSGQPFDKERLPQLFDLNAQLATLSGSGQAKVDLALALVGELIRLHGGTVQASARTDRSGMETVIQLPGAE